LLAAPGLSKIICLNTDMQGTRCAPSITMNS
jgi:hypothetical protein